MIRPICGLDDFIISSMVSDSIKAEALKVYVVKYSAREGFCNTIAEIAYKIWNAILHLFNCSDYQKAHVIVKEALKENGEARLPADMNMIFLNEKLFEDAAYMILEGLITANESHTDINANQKAILQKIILTLGEIYPGEMPENKLRDLPGEEKLAREKKILQGSYLKILVLWLLDIVKKFKELPSQQQGDLLSLLNEFKEAVYSSFTEAADGSLNTKQNQAIVRAAYVGRFATRVLFDKRIQLSLSQVEENNKFNHSERAALAYFKEIIEAVNKCENMVSQDHLRTLYVEKLGALFVQLNEAILHENQRHIVRKESPKNRLSPIQEVDPHQPGEFGGGREGQISRRPSQPLIIASPSPLHQPGAQPFTIPVTLTPTPV